MRAPPTLAMIRGTWLLGVLEAVVDVLVEFQLREY
jgi:hypothetical protein